ncbi:MAG TPA: OmpA family protein [Hyphomicrobiaceae bacterium]|nr:OmpA family protein [Hyphomicrobiaceae bacterium]
MSAVSTLGRMLLGIALFRMVSAAPAAAEDALKELLGKAQSEAQQQAVEELIRKLQGARGAPSRPTAPAAPPPASAPPQTVEPAIEARPTSDPPATAAKEPQPKTEATKEAAGAPQPAPPDATAPPAAAATAAEDKSAVAAAQRAVESADRRELPSVDLEVYFEVASAEITPQAAATLAPLGRALADPRLADGTFLIAGHSDAQGPAGYNRRLSQKRAEAVRQFLIATFGIKQERLVAQGFGEERLKNPARPAAAENRRVQIVNMTRQAAR